MTDRKNSGWPEYGYHPTDPDKDVISGDIRPGDDSKSLARRERNYQLERQADKTIALPSGQGATDITGRRKVGVLVITIAFLSIAVIVLLVVVLTNHQKVATAIKPSNTVSAPASEPTSRSTTTSPSTSPSPTSSPSGPTGSPSPIAPPITPVYSNKILTIPPLASTDVGNVTFTNPPHAALGLVSSDLSMQNGNGWQASNTLAPLGNATPSYQSCQAALNGQPMNLDTQDFQEGAGYCMELSETQPINSIVYFVFTSPVANGRSGDSSSQMTIRATLWQTSNSN